MSYIRADGYSLTDHGDDDAFQKLVGDVQRLYLAVYKGANGVGGEIDTSSFLLAASNLSDLADIPTARTNLGLGSAALLPSSSFLQAANNLSDVASAATARTNLGLGTAATASAASFLAAANNLSDVSSAATARTNLLGSGTRAYQVALWNGSAWTVAEQGLLFSYGGSTGNWQADTGGNQRGDYSFDIQTSRLSATNVASGTRSAVLGGRNNTASGTRSIAFGSLSTASGVDSVAIGTVATASHDGSVCIGLISSVSDNSVHIGGPIYTNGDYYRDGVKILGTQMSHVNGPTGGATVDLESRAAIDSVLFILQNHGLMA